MTGTAPLALDGIPAVSGLAGRGWHTIAFGDPHTVLAAHADTSAASWRLSLCALDAGSAVAAPVGSCRTTAALDSPITFGSDTRTRLRLQSARLADDGSLVHATEAGRVICLQWETSLDAELLTRPLNGPMLLPFREDTHWLAWLLSGRAHWQSDDVQWPLEPDRPQWLATRPGQRMRLEGGGEIVLVRVSPRHAITPTGGLTNT